MKPGSKYYPLFNHLQTSDQAEVVLTFGDIEALLGGPLPKSAVARKNWWSNRDTPAALQSGAWVGAGYQVHGVDLGAKTVTFRKFSAQYNIEQKDGRIIWQQDAIRALRKHMSLTQMEFAEQMGVRRQTVSEWENGLYDPDRSTSKFLELLAKTARFEPPPPENP